MTSKYLIVDAHEDLAWNMVAFGRDYARPAAETRRLEVDSDIPAYNGDTLLGWPDYQAGKVAIVFGTLFVSPKRGAPGGWDSQAYTDANEAHQLYWRQVEQYHRFIDDHPDLFRLVETRPDLQAVLAGWQESLPQEQFPAQKPGNPVGVVMLMEGAEGVRTPDELGDWWEAGVRIIGPAWMGTRFCGGTHEPGPMTTEGWELLEAMHEIGFTLDISHMDEKAALQALDGYPGRIVASHANALALLKGIEGNRHLSDRVISRLVERQGMVGVIPFNTFLLPGWKLSDGKKSVSLDSLVAHIDHICQLAGDARHVGLGSDFDGGFGYLSTPAEVNTIADLQKLAPMLQQKGYGDADIAAIFGLNWVSLLEQTLP